jgi:rhodanese-related sulfurtransferase
MNFLGSFFGEPVPTVRVQDLEGKLKGGNLLFLLDVREPEEFRLGHIAGAKLIPLGELDRRIKEVPRDREIACICASGNRSVTAAQILKAAGLTASSVKNGMIGWQMAGLPIIKGM